MTEMTKADMAKSLARRNAQLADYAALPGRAFTPRAVAGVGVQRRERSYRGGWHGEDGGAMNHGRRDANHGEIVAALRQAGASVLDLADVGHGCPDLLVYYAGRLWLLEVKTPTGKLTADEVLFAQAWPVCVVRSVAEALAVIGKVEA